jgi:hypothetical protein
MVDKNIICTYTIKNYNDDDPLNSTGAFPIYSRAEGKGEYTPLYPVKLSGDMIRSLGDKYAVVSSNVLGSPQDPFSLRPSEVVEAKASAIVLNTTTWRTYTVAAPSTQEIITEDIFDKIDATKGGVESARKKGQ